MRFTEDVREAFRFALTGLQPSVKTFATRHNVEIALRPFEAPGTQVSVHRTKKYRYTIYFPSGFVLKFALLSALFRFSVRGPRVVNSLSFLDRRDLSFDLPRRLRVVFDPAETFDEETAAGLIEDYCDQPVDFTWVHSISDAVHFLTLHELGHISLGHLEFSDYCSKRRSEATEATLGLSEFDLRQGFEVAADQFAAGYFASALLGKIHTYRERGLYPEQAAIELGFTIALFVSLFDVRSRSLDVSSHEYHPHPLLRYTIISFGMCEALTTAGHQGVAKLYWKHVRDCANAVAGKVCGVYFEELHREGQRHLPATDTVPICPLKFDENLISESVFLDFLTRTAERGRRMDVRINMHKEFSFVGLAGLKKEYFDDVDERWQTIRMRLEASRQIRDLCTAGLRFESFYGPIRKSPGTGIHDIAKAKR